MNRIIGVGLLAGLLFASELQAGNGAVSLSPAVVMLTGDVGQTTTQTLTFTNGTSRPFSFEMRAQDVVVRDGRRMLSEAGKLAGSIAATAVFSGKSFTVAPGQTANIRVTVTVPPHSPVRAIGIMCQGTTTFGSGPMRTTAAVGTLMTFSLTGDTLTAEAAPLTVEPPTATANFVAAQQVANRGTAPIVATGMLAIVDAKGSLAGKQAIPAWRMLPEERTDVRVEYGGALAPGHYRALVTYDLTEKTLTSSAEFDVH